MSKWKTIFYRGDLKKESPATLRRVRKTLINYRRDFYLLEIEERLLEAINEELRQRGEAETPKGVR